MPDDLDVWITEQADFEPSHKTGKGWRYRALRNNSVAAVMAATNKHHRTSFTVPNREWLILVKHINKSGLNINQATRLALVEFLQRRTGLDPTEVPVTAGLE